jgi:hypothetical protein
MPAPGRCGDAWESRSPVSILIASATWLGSELRISNASGPVDRQQESRAAIGGLMRYFAMPGNDIVQNRKVARQRR